MCEYVRAYICIHSLAFGFLCTSALLEIGGRTP